MVKEHKIGNYVITEKIGKGSFSNVYKSHHINDNTKLYAIKVISIKKHGNSKIIENIHNEINIMMKIQHENIIKLHETIITISHIYLVMDYCDQDLHQYIKNNGCLSEDTIKYYFKQISNGIQFLHSNNLIHRDLKPHNILILSSSNIIKIADFGFVKENIDNNLLNTLCGSPIYMAPEILKYQKYDNKVDLWSIGIILFEMITAKPPFNASNHLELINVIETQKYKIPDDIIISSECIDLLSKLIVVNPKRRIEFDDFFNHSFLNCNNQICNIIEEENVEEKKNDKEEEVENELSKTVIIIEADPLIEVLLNYKIYLESLFISSVAIGNLGFKKESEFKFIDAFSVYMKALRLLSHGISVCENINSVNENIIIKTIYTEIKRKFSIYLEKSQYIYDQIKDININVMSSEKLIYDRSLQMIQEGLGLEMLNEINESQTLYIWSIRLLESLTMDENPLSKYDQHIIDSLIKKVTKRLKQI